MSPAGSAPYPLSPLIRPPEEHGFVGGLLWTWSSTQSCLLCPKCPLTFMFVPWWWKDIPSLQMEPGFYLSR